jgi:hypothetical protein
MHKPKIKALAYYNAALRLGFLNPFHHLLTQTENNISENAHLHPHVGLERYAVSKIIVSC